MVLSNGKVICGLNPSDNAVQRDKLLLRDWVNFKIPTSKAVEIFNNRNSLNLTEGEFVEYVAWLGWRLGEYE